MANEKSLSKFPSLFGDWFENDAFFSPENFFKGINRSLPAANVKENDKAFHIELAVPGFKKEDIKVQVEGDMLNVSAETRSEKKDENEKYNRREFSYSSFARSFRLPESVQQDNISAKYENGILELVVAKKEPGSGNSNKKLIAVN